MVGVTLLQMVQQPTQRVYGTHAILRIFPLAIKQGKPSLVEGKSDWELLNMSTNDILALLDGLSSEEYNAVKEHSARDGENLKQLSKWVVPQTKHYS